VWWVFGGGLQLLGSFLLLSIHLSLWLIQKNRAINVTALLDICFNIVPSYAALLYNVVGDSADMKLPFHCVTIVQIAGQTLANALGQYLAFLCSIDMLSCAIFYTLVMFKRFQRPANKVTTVMVAEAVTGHRNMAPATMTAVEPY